MISAIVLALCSCVGTVEDKNPLTTKGAAAKTTPLTFEGIFQATPIAHDKVDVFFYPAVGDPRSFTYFIYYDGASQPITIPGATLRTDYRGLLKTTISNLQIGTTYSFNVQAQDENENRSTNTLTQTATTFTNQTANFSGVAVVRNLSGADGRNALRVEWPEAERIGSVFSPKEVDPVQYEITVVDGDQLTPAAFDDISIGEPNRRIVYVSDSKIAHNVEGLKSGTKYYIRVRAIHYGFSQNSANISYKREANSNYYLAQTLSDQLGDIDVDLSVYNVNPSAGSAGLTAFDVSWDPARAAFQEYRVYYHQVGDGSPWSSFQFSRHDVCNGPDANEPQWSCKRVNYDLSNTVVTDLQPFKNYEVVTVICLNSDCLPAESIAYYHNSPYRTEPGVAPFGGIEEIELAKNYWAIDELYLKITPPDLSAGVMDGILVELLTRSDVAADTILNHPQTSQNSGYSVSNFNFATDDTIVVNGINPFSAEQYCFRLIPYVWDNGVVDEKRSGVVDTCITAEIKAPSVEEFTGLKLDSISADAITDSISLAWDPPTAGIYNKYVLFVRINAGVFNFGDAINPANPDYVRIEIPYGQTSYNINFLPNGTYSFGVLTYYDLTDEYSIFNGNSFTFINL